MSTTTPVTRFRARAQVSGLAARPALGCDLGRRSVCLRHPGGSGELRLWLQLHSEIVRPRLDADHLNEAFSTLEVVWVGRI
jgi:hypothetical protein